MTNHTLTVPSLTVTMYRALIVSGKASNVIQVERTTFPIHGSVKTKMRRCEIMQKEDRSLVKGCGNEGGGGWGGVGGGVGVGWGGGRYSTLHGLHTACTLNAAVAAMTLIR